MKNELINYNSLSDKNKEELFAIEETKDSKGANIGEEIVWFVKNSFMDIFNIGKSDEKKSTLNEKFEERSFVLQYNFDRYQKKVVILRMPIDDRTKVTDVERYFEKLTERLKQQQVERKSPSMDRSE